MIILDTNVLSEHMSTNPSRQVLAWIAQQPARELFTTCINEAEIFYGIELLSKGRRRENLMALAEAIIGNEFAGRVFSFESDAARAYARTVSHRRRLGRPISHEDAQIAAIAQVRGAKIATRNVADFDDCSLIVIDPWNKP
jgi:predicted nucleic acid-binding protein